MGVSNSIILPFIGVSFDNSKAVQGPATLPVQALIMGQKIAAGSAVEGVLYLITSADEARTLGGVGSQIHRLAVKWFNTNKLTPTYIVTMADAGGSAAAIYSLPITGTATAPGELPVYIDAKRFAVSVATGDTAATLGAALVTAINADTTLGLTAAFTAGALVLTAANKGVSAGDFSVLVNYYPGEITPAGITVGTLTTTPGTGEPDVAAALAAVGDMWFNIYVGSYSDGTNLAKIETFLEAQAGVDIQKDGEYYTAKKDSLSNMITYGTDTARNCPWVVTEDGYGCPEGVGAIASAVAAATALSIVGDPAVPLHRMVLDLLPALPSARRTMAERNQLAKAGVATLRHDNGVQTEATVTMYLRNVAGAADISYQYQNSMFILMNMRYTFVQRILLKYARAKLASSADRVASGQQIITPDLGRAEAVAWFLDLEAAGQVENLKQFKADLVCRRSTTNPNRLEWILPPDLINQFIVGSADLQFRL